MSLFAELKRRNVFRVAAAYIIVGWLIMQVGEVMAPALNLPDWILSALAFFVILGFPLAVIFAWAFEMTPEGLKLEKNVERDASITHVTGQKLNVTIIVLLALTLGYFAFDKFVLDPGRDAAKIEAAVQTAPGQAPPAESAAEKSIAVLPFVNMSSDEEQEFFSDGLSEELLNLLAKIPDLRVAARTSSFSFKGQNIEIPEIAARLGVAHVLEGSVRKAGNQVRITAQLIKADDGFHLWSETYDRTLENIFQIQGEIAAHVVDALKVTLLGSAPTVRETDPEAYQLFLEGRYFALQRNEDSLHKSIELFKRVVEIDPGYAPAWAELAYSYQWYAGIGAMSIEEGHALSSQALDMAMVQDPNLALVYIVRGLRSVYYRFDFAQGIEDWKRALELEPGNAFVVGFMGAGYRVMGQFDQAAAMAERARQLDPILPEIYSALGNVHWLTGQFEQAETEYRKVLELSPAFAGGQLRLGRTYLARGDAAGALAVIEQEPQEIYRLCGMAMAQHDLGNFEQSRGALESLIDKGADHAAYQIAEAFGHTGRVDEAFEWLERSLEIHDSGLAALLGDPAFRSLWRDPRWPEFLRKLGLLQAWMEMPPEWGGPQS